MYIEREIFKKFEKLSQLYNVISIVGPRQAGKTTFLKETGKKYKFSYVTFDDPDARSLFEDIKKFELQYIEGFEISILDEAQYSKEPGIKLKYLADKNRKLWLTSSSELLLGKEVMSYLVGRSTVIRLFPFSFKEFLNAKEIKSLNNEIEERLTWEHILYGGYPRVVLTKEAELKKQVLSDLYELMLLKDVSKTFSIQDIAALEKFTKYMAVNIGTQIQYNHISNDLKISFQTIIKFFDALEKSYLIQRIMPFYSNKSKEIIKQPKIYFLDTGLRNASMKLFDINVSGNLFENYVLTELIKLGIMPKYWRTKTGEEVDFIVTSEDNLIPIEVKLKSELTKGMRSFIDIYKPKKALILSYKKENSLFNYNGCKIITGTISELKSHFS